MTKHFSNLFWFLIVLYFAVSLNHQALSSDKMISERIKNMQMADHVMGDIKEDILKSDFQAVAQNAKSILIWADKMINYFPEGSGASVSNTSATSYEIWKDFNSFKSHIETKRKNLKSLLLAAKNNDMKLVRKSFKATSENCKSCHEKFRN
jgi:cytochrome c556